MVSGISLKEYSSLVGRGWSPSTSYTAQNDDNRFTRLLNDCKIKHTANLMEIIPKCHGSLGSKIRMRAILNMYTNLEKDMLSISL